MKICLDIEPGSARINAAAIQPDPAAAGCSKYIQQYRALLQPERRAVGALC